MRLAPLANEQPWPAVALLYKRRPMHPKTVIARVCLFALVAYVTGLPVTAQATDRALLIGVSDYPALPKRLWLRGPGNDVALMRGLLLDKGFAASDIHTLTSRVAPEPTRANILREMQALRASIQPGDRVMFYLAGHGAQQPQPAQHGARPTEADGLDEVFLPADAARWDGQGDRAAVPNALLDDEIGEWMDALVDAGATVWGVFDTCHAGGMARGGEAAATTRWRSVSAGELGLPALRASAVSALTSLPRLQQGRTDGRSLAFAARSHELAGEEWLPRGVAMGQTKVHGVFTYHLVAALRQPADALAGLPSAMAMQYRVERRAAPTPQFKGAANLRWP